MSKTMAAFYEGPPYLEMLNRIQRQINLMTRPLLDMQQDYAALTKNLSAALDSPAIRNINKISSALDSRSMAAIYRTQEIVSKIDMSGMVSALQQFQIAIDTVAPMQLQVQLGERIQEWSRVISNSIPYQIEPLTKARVAELTRLTSLAEEYTIGEAAEECHILSEDEQKIVVSEVEDILLSGKNWEQRFAEQIKSFSQTHPVIAWVLEKIFFAILIGIITNIASSAIGKALSPANVYEEPNSSSQIVYHIELNQNVVVVGDVPYYYEVEIQDESSGCRYAGYVSKRSISLMESEEK